MSPTRCAHNGRSGASRFTNGGEGGLATSIRLQTKMQINQLNPYLSMIPGKMCMLQRQALRENLHKYRQPTKTALLGSLHDHCMIYHARSHHPSTGHSCIVFNFCLQFLFVEKDGMGFKNIGHAVCIVPFHQRATVFVEYRTYCLTEGFGRRRFLEKQAVQPYAHLSELQVEEHTPILV